MRLVTIVCLVAFVSACHPQPYRTVKTAPDRFYVSGPDPNQLQANAYAACKNDGMDDYSVVDSGRNYLTVKCEKKPKSFFSTASDAFNKAWVTFEKKIDEWQQKDKTNTTTPTTFK